MRQNYIDFLFAKGFLVNDSGEKNSAIETIISLGSLFYIQITSGHHLACPSMIEVASRNLGIDVPEPFYRGFPESVRKLNRKQLLFDQVVHYITTYGFGDFSTPGHSVLEKDFKRLCFMEHCEPKQFKILSLDEAEALLAQSIVAFCDSSRPLNDVNYHLLRDYIADYNYQVKKCNCKDTIVRLLLDTKDIVYATLLSLSDVIRLAEQLQYQEYKSTDIKKLNFKNQDRKFLTKVLDQIFAFGKCDVITCFEKKKVWAGLLHHIHYKPKCQTALQFLADMRGDKNKSVYALFEEKMQQGHVLQAVQLLKKHKGEGALLRNLNYVLSRCQYDNQLEEVLGEVTSNNKIVMLQLLLQYNNYKTETARTFKFSKFNLLRLHQETPEEIEGRKSVLSKQVSDLACKKIRQNLEDSCRGTLGKVFVDEDMQKIALPLQENTSSSGFGVLPKGSRLAIPDGKLIRAFTYWEKVNDIDLSAFGITDEGQQIEFSWRSMYGKQSDGITFSGDQTSGYNGGSEYFDIKVDKFRQQYPNVNTIVFCNNVFSRQTFDQCFCKAGFMSRDKKPSGKVYEPKTVKTSFVVNCNSTFAYLFAIDLVKREFVWLNVSRDSNLHVAGMSPMAFLLDYLDITDVVNLHDFGKMLATEVVDDPMQADVVFSDKDIDLPANVSQIRSCDVDKVVALLNK